jgi:hypothetical protein
MESSTKNYQMKYCISIKRMYFAACVEHFSVQLTIAYALSTVNLYGLLKHTETSETR